MKTEPTNVGDQEPSSPQWNEVLEEIKRKETRNYFEEVIEENLYPLQQNVEMLMVQRPDLHLIEIKDLLAQALLVANAGRAMSEDDLRYEAVKSRLEEILRAMKAHADASALADESGVLKLISERFGLKDPQFTYSKKFPQGPFTFIDPDEGHDRPTIH